MGLLKSQPKNTPIIEPQSPLRALLESTGLQLPAEILGRFTDASGRYKAAIAGIGNDQAELVNLIARLSSLGEDIARSKADVGWKLAQNKIDEAEARQILRSLEDEKNLIEAQILGRERKIEIADAEIRDRANELIQANSELQFEVDMATRVVLAIVGRPFMAAVRKLVAANAGLGIRTLGLQAIRVNDPQNDQVALQIDPDRHQGDWASDPEARPVADVLDGYRQLVMQATERLNRMEQQRLAKQVAADDANVTRGIEKRAISGMEFPSGTFPGEIVRISKGQTNL